MASNREETTPSTFDKLTSFNQERGSFEELYVDDNIARKEVETEVKRKSLSKPAKAALKTAEFGNAATSKKSEKSASTEKRITRSASASDNNSTTDSITTTGLSTLVETTLGDISTGADLLMSAIGNADNITPSGSVKVNTSKQSSFKDTITNERPRFAEADPDYRAKGTPKYPGQIHQNALNMPEASFNKVKAPGPQGVTGEALQSDLITMGIAHDELPTSTTKKCKPASGSSAYKQTCRARDGKIYTIGEDTEDEDDDTPDTIPAVAPPGFVSETPKPAARAKKTKPARKSSESDEARKSSSTESASRGQKRGLDDTPTSTTKRSKPNTDKSPPTPRRSTRTVRKTYKAASDDDDIEPPPATPKVQRVSDGKIVKPASKKKPILKSAVEEDEELDDESEIEKTPGKTKTAPEPTISKSFVGQPSHHGYSLNQPPEAKVITPWQCAEPSCASGMTWLAFETVARKVVSHYFGRNKKETKTIPQTVWHSFCRKHYQQGRYASINNASDKTTGQNNKAACLNTIDNIENQLLRLELWRPQAVFKVQIITAAGKRVSLYNKLKRQKQPGDNSPVIMPTSNNKTPTPEQDFPIDLILHFEDHFAGEQKSYADLRAVLAWLKNAVNTGMATVLCPCEFLITGVETKTGLRPRTGEVVNDPQYNYQEWECAKGGKVFDFAAAYVPGQALPAVVDSEDES